MATVEMCKFMEPGEVVLVLARCYSGCKVVIMKNIDDGISDDPYSHALVGGTDSNCCGQEENYQEAKG